MATTDGTQVLLLAGTKLGTVGSVVTLSASTATAEIAAGRAALADATETSAATSTSATTPGVAGQITFDANFIYICTVTGAAGKATWKKAALSAA